MYNALKAIFLLLNSPFISTLSPLKPHIVMVVADDLGWNDVSFHGSDQIPTPNIDMLANDGVTLDNYYVLPLCTPTRSAIMTGRYPIHTGMQSHTISCPQPYGVSLNETFLPEYLRQQGYANHAIGKWHVGFYAKEFTPTYRGFDTFYGYYCGKSDYWNHWNTETFSGLDLHDNEEPVFTQWGNYSTEMFTAEAIGRIEQHNVSRPLFLYLSYQAVHSANTPQDPLQAPQDWIDKFKYIKHRGRRKYAAMVAYMDYCIGKLHSALLERGMLDNTVIVFTTDNGGPANGLDNNWANNYPLRGAKRSLFQGGVRGTGFVYSKLLNQPGRISRDLIHVTDWLPTFVKLAGGELKNNLDGVDQWDTLQNKSLSPRAEVLLNIDTSKMQDNEALLVEDWKIIKDETGWDEWYKPHGGGGIYNLTVKCGGRRLARSTGSCSRKHCIFNLKDDPCETKDLSLKYPAMLATLKERLQRYKDSMVPSRKVKYNDPLANPKLHNGVWKPWVDLK